jgi:hypothetical protein
MKTKEPAKPKKQTVAVRDLKTKRNPKGGIGNHTITASYQGSGSTKVGQGTLVLSTNC